MKDFILYNIEVISSLTIFYLFYYVSLRKETNHGFVRVYLLSALVFSFGYPFISINFITETVNQLPPVLYMKEFVMSDQVVETPSTPYISFTTIALIIYGTVSIVLLSKFLIELFKIISLRRIGFNTTDLNQIEGYKIIIHKSILPTFSFLNTIYLSIQDLDPAASRDKILIHELAHVKGAHSLDIIFVQLIKIIFWFNPLVYAFNSALTISHEYIADKNSVRDGDQQHYVNLLVDQTLSNLGLSLGSHFGKKSGILPKWLSINNSQTLKRIKMIKNQKKMNKLKYLIPVFALVLSVTVISCSQDETLSAEEETIEIDLDVQKSETSESGTNPVFTIVEDKPVFQGGDKGMYKYLGKSIDYPASARAAGIEGRVFVQFIINKEGKVTDVKKVGEPDPSLAEEAIRVISEMPNWTPGKQRGQNVAVRMILPVFFKLNGSKKQFGELKKPSGNIKEEIVVVAYQKEKQIKTD